MSDWLAELWSSIGSISDQTEAYVLSYADSFWVYVGIWAVALIDAIFPVVPSESVVIASSTLWSEVGVPIVGFVWLAAAAGAWCGDQLGYTIGTRVNIHKVPILRSRRGLATLAWAEKALEARGTSFIIAARFIPGGRVAVNLTAGALRFPRKRFMAVAGVAAAIWASYSVALGVFAGAIVKSNLFVSVSVGVIGGVVLGYGIDALLQRFGVRRPELPAIDEIPPPTKILRRRGHDEDASHDGDASESDGAGASR